MDNLKQPRQKRSFVWRHFRKLSNNRSKCALCGKIISTSGGAISNLARHLKAVHKTYDLTRASVATYHNKVDDNNEVFDREHGVILIHNYTDGDDEMLVPEIGMEMEIPIEEVKEINEPIIWHQPVTPSDITVINDNIKIIDHRNSEKTQSSNKSDALIEIADNLSRLASSFEAIAEYILERPKCDGSIALLSKLGEVI